MSEKTKRDEIEESLENENELYNEFLDGAKDVADLIPHVQERKKETEVKLTFVKLIPDDVFVEYEDYLYDLQMNDEQQANQYTPTLPNITPTTIRHVTSGSSSTSAYSEIHNMVVNFGGIGKYWDTEWREPISTAFTDLAEEKARKKYLPESLNKIQPNLGEMFNVVIESVEKAKSEVVGVDQAAVQMRDVIEELWGGIANIAREKGPKYYKKIRLELRKQRSRDIVVECLANDDGIKAKKLVTLLNSMTKLHSDLSQKELTKNPLGKDINRLDTIYGRWILIIDDVVGFFIFNFEIG